MANHDGCSAPLSPLLESKPLRRLLAAGCLSLAVTQTYAGTAEKPFRPAALFQETQRASLESTPKVLRLYEDELIVLASQNAQSQISILDANTLTVRATHDLPMTPEDMVIDQHGTIFILGTVESGNNQVVALDLTLKRIDRFDTDKKLIQPVLSLPGVDTLLVGSMTEPMLVIDTQNPDSLQLSTTFKPPDYSTGVGQTWVSADYKTLFINLSTNASLVAYDIASTRQLSNIGYPAKGTEIEPYKVVTVTGQHPCRSATDASFLIWDTPRDSLTLAEFDPAFRSLDIQTTVQTGLGTQAVGELDRVPGTRVLKSSGLLASNCDQSAIFLGSKHSNRIVQFAVNKEYRSIEVTGHINAGFKAVSVVMDPQGHFAMLASAEKQLIARYAPQAKTGEPYVQGDPTIRKLQRLLTDNGYPVGSVDGIMGPATQRALDLFEKNTDIKVDLDNLNTELEKTRAYSR